LTPLGKCDASLLDFFSVCSLRFGYQLVALGWFVHFRHGAAGGVNYYEVGTSDGTAVSGSAEITSDPSIAI
jgi:hypothetical protein